MLSREGPNVRDARQTFLRRISDLLPWFNLPSTMESRLIGTTLTASSLETDPRLWGKLHTLISSGGRIKRRFPKGSLMDREQILLKGRKGKKGNLGKRTRRWMGLCFRISVLNMPSQVQPNVE